VARTRAQRRRSNLLIAVALAATLVVLLFARDINRAAHASDSIRRSENRSFASLANDLLASESSFGFHLGYLLSHGATLTRPVFAARLDQLAMVLPTWTTDAGLLRHPGIDHDVNGVLVDLTQQRVDDYQVVLATTAGALRLPWSTPGPSGLTSVAARSSLLASDRQWDGVRRDLVHDPGAVHLAPTSTPSSVVTLPTTLESLSAAPSLRLVRGVAISAVAVTPAPLPAPVGRIVLPPVAHFHLGVSVTNTAFVLQPVTFSVTLTPLSGSLAAPQSETMSVTLGPLRSFAFVPRLFATAPGEHARLVVSVSAPASAAAPPRHRTYQVILSPGG